MAANTLGPNRGLTTPSSVLLPNPYIVVQQPPPTAAQLRSSLDTFLLWNYIRTIEDGKGRHHYENELYGVLNTLFFGIFPLSRRFMIEPQILLRKFPLTVQELQQRNRAGSDISISSLGTLHESRKIKNQPRGGNLAPDFGVVKVCPSQQPNPRLYVLLSIVEVKGEKDKTKQIGQMLQYMERIAEVPTSHRHSPFCGYILNNTQYMKWTLGLAPNFIITRTGWLELRDGQDLFIKELCTLSTQYWNRITLN
ncbi:hypothetical protein K525DRAFT_262221, partial [Schizophyllum commune Loenen D]